MKMAAISVQKHGKNVRNISDSRMLNKSFEMTDSDEQDKIVKQFLQKFWKINDGEVNSSYDSLVKELLTIEWIFLKGDLMKEYKAFLLHVATTNTYYLKSVFHMLVRKFVPTNTEQFTSISGSKMMTRTSIDDYTEAQFAESHSLIQNIIVLVPLSPVILVNILTESFPYFTREENIQVCYLKNLLHMTSYLPSQRRTLLEIIVNHLTKLDVHSPRHEILNSEAVPRDEDEFNMELDEPTNSHPTGSTLDSMMTLMFQYIHDACYTEEKLNWEATKLLYQDLILLFDKLILPTHACCHVQFLMFYICSFKQSLSNIFLEWLWKKIEDPNAATILRQASVAYISSFLARSNFILLKNVTHYLNAMCQWIHHYIDNDGGGSRSTADVTVHGPFYSVCQAVFYIFAFRHKEIVEMPKGFLFLRNLNLQRIVTCRLNPLKVCLPTVVQNFASVARNYQLAYCYTIIERNQRASLPVISFSAAKKVHMTNINPLDSFFPFDPYILSRSSLYISPLFNEYQNEAEEKEVISDTEEDDFLDASMITPDVVTSMPDFLVYSTSPGFKLSPT